MHETTIFDIDAAVSDVQVGAYTIPTDSFESDGTFEWDSTTIVVVEVTAGDCRGLGYTYADAATAHFIQDHLAKVVSGGRAMNVSGAFVAMRRAIRNLGRAGVASMAISAVDIALWDLKARLLGLPLVALLGQVRTEVPAYGSGGFTSYTLRQLERQLSEWVEAGLTRVKIKIGRDIEQDRLRVQAARHVIDDHAELFIDANGAYTRKLALSQAQAFANERVTWFEEPVSSDDLSGLRLLRDRAPAGMQIAAGEYGYDPIYFRRMLEAEAVDVLQADATRCGGITGFLQVGSLCDAWGLPLSAHTAPSLHAHCGCAVDRVCHVEYFHDHARIEQMLFDGALVPNNGMLRPDSASPGMGLQLKRSVASQFAI